MRVYSQEKIIVVFDGKDSSSRQGVWMGRIEKKAQQAFQAEEEHARCLEGKKQNGN